VQEQFLSYADELVDESSDSPRCEAMRKARLSNPRLHKALQRTPRGMGERRRICCVSSGL